MTVLKAVSSNEVEIKNCEYHFSLVYDSLRYLSFILVIFHPKCGVMIVRYKHHALSQQTIQNSL
jgi:hypothetical protein